MPHCTNKHKKSRSLVRKRERTMTYYRSIEGRLPHMHTCTPHSIKPCNPDNVYLFEHENARLFLTTPWLLHGSAHQTNPSFHSFSAGAQWWAFRRWAIRGGLDEEEISVMYLFGVFANWYMIAVACRAVPILYHWATASPKKKRRLPMQCDAVAEYTTQALVPPCTSWVSIWKKRTFRAIFSTVVGSS